MERVRFAGGTVVSKEQEKGAYTIETENKIGEVRIADEVVAVIAGLAATEVEGVASMAGNVTRDLIEKLGVKSLSKGVKILVQDGEVKVAMNINMNYGYNVPDTCTEIQDKVKTAIETMTGLTVSEVNIKIASVVMDNGK